MRRSVGITIETFKGAGQYQHTVFDIGIKGGDRSKAVPEEVVDALKRANELAYEAMPKGSRKLISKLTYIIPNKS